MQTIKVSPNGKRHAPQEHGLIRPTQYSVSSTGETINVKIDFTSPDMRVVLTRDDVRLLAEAFGFIPKASDEAAVDGWSQNPAAHAAFKRHFG